MGAVFDQTYTVDGLVRQICKDAIFHLANISSVWYVLRRNLPSHALISGLLQCPTTWHNRNTSSQAPASTQYGSSTCEYNLKAKPYYSDTQSSERRIIFKLLLLTLKSDNTLEFRSSDSHQLAVPCTGLTTTGDTAFAHFSPRIWIDPPLHIRSRNKLINFISMLMQHLSTRA